MFIYSYQTALWLSATLFPVLWIYLFVIRKKLRLYGQAENEIHWKQWRLVTETFKGYAEVTLSHAFPLFFKRFKVGLEEITHYRRHSDKIQRLPSVRNLLNGWVLLKNNAYTIDSEWHRIVGYVPQDVFILDGTLAENIALGEESINEERLKQALRQSNLDEFVRSLPEGIHTPIGENGCRLSGGQRQRIGIARALYKQAEVLFFDEATSSLDSQTEQEITGAINRLSAGNRQLTILIIAHRETSLAGCDRIVYLS
ncbi:hypothetical protein FACS189426_09460 [Bacteroidia bacterium]|nr:hypothetical protein FACS189426_09460 [Bacteroidia bacterium]